MKPIRDLRADEIDCRVQSVKEKGLVLLLYKDARVDMNILDETFGAENWQREHYECKGNLFCRIGVLFKGTGEWVWKSDCGTESNTEAQKGEASDSFKRAGFNWGIGRELYTAPFIWVDAAKCNIKNGKCYDDFTVTSIAIKDKTIIGLTIRNNTKGCIAYQMGAASAPAPQQPAKAPEKPKRETEKNIEHAVQKADPPKQETPKYDDEIKALRAELNKKAKEIMSVTGFDATKVNEILCDKCSINKPIIKEDYQQLLIAAGVMLGELYDRKD